MQKDITLHIAAMRGYLFDTQKDEGITLEDVNRILMTPLSAFGNLSMTDYLIQGGSVNDVWATLKRMYRG